MQNEKRKTVWTIGHSTRSADEFINLLRDFDIRQIVDVRRMPGSRKFPQFNQKPFKQMLDAHGISYHHIELLGGRRKPAKESHNTAWRNASFRAYADYMETDDFEKGFNRLKELAAEKNTALLCAEAVWWRCHRSLISDKLKAQGWKVIHIMDLHQKQEHPYTKPAKVSGGKLTYA